MSMTASVEYCVSDHLATPRSRIVGHRNCIAKKNRDAEFPGTSAACRRSYAYASERFFPWNMAGATWHSEVLKRRKTLMYSEGTCCEAEGTFVLFFMSALRRWRPGKHCVDYNTTSAGLFVL